MNNIRNAEAARVPFSEAAPPIGGVFLSETDRLSAAERLAEYTSLLEQIQRRIFALSSLMLDRKTVINLATLEETAGDMRAVALAAIEASWTKPKVSAVDRGKSDGR